MRKALSLLLFIFLLFSYAQSENLGSKTKCFKHLRYNNWVACVSIYQKQYIITEIIEILDETDHTGFTWTYRGIDLEPLVRDQKSVIFNKKYLSMGEILAAEDVTIEEDLDLAFIYRTMEVVLIVAAENKFPDNMNQYKTEILDKRNSLYPDL